MSDSPSSAVPRLRFPEFVEDWASSTLGNEATFLDSQRIPLSQEDRSKRQGNYPYYGASGIIDYIDDYIFDGEFVLLGEDGANILTRSTRLAFTINGKNWVNNHAHVMQARGSNYFLAESLERIDYNQYNSGTAQPKLNAKTCKGIELKIPALPEQRKIADFLTAVDGRIGQLIQKKALLEDYKKGVMQQLFTQAIRFKDDHGNDFPDWEEKKLGEVSDVRDGTHESPKYQATGHPLVTSKNLQKDGTIDMSNVDLISKEDFQAINKRSNVDKGDIVFGMIGTIGNPVIVSEAGFAIKNVALIKEQTQLLNKFLIHYLESTDIARQFHVENTGGTQKFIALGVIRKLLIRTPHLPEQTKIADFLSAIDRKIESVATQITETQTFKRGLLQQMFV